MTAVKRILRYLKETINLGLKYEKSVDLDDRHSTSGNLFLMAGGAISWFSKKQPTVALSTAEAEYISLFCNTRSSLVKKITS